MKVFLKALIPLLLSLALVHSGFASKPNIILFFVDDMGWADSGVYGSEFFETPAIDAFAEANIRFTNGYAQPLCSPSRAALLTGKYAGRHRLHRAITGASVPDPQIPEKPQRADDLYYWPESRNHLPLEEVTLAEILKEAGYDTWFIGKWHLGGKPFYPEHQGFDSWYGVGGAAPSGSYFSPFRVPEMPAFADEDKYMPEVLTDEAIRLIQNRGEEPFFLYFSHFNVHAPYQAREADIEYFAEKADESSPQRNPIMAGMIRAVDESFEKLLGTLESEGITEDTILIFLSDNGGVHWAKAKGPASTRLERLKIAPPTSNVPLRGGKSSYYEGGVRVPLIASWPTKWKGKRTVDTPVHLIDILPTLAEVAEVTKQALPTDIDGKSIEPILEDQDDTHLKERPLFCHFPRRSTTAGTNGGSFIRKGPYKLIKTWNRKGLAEDNFASYELYHLENDIDESENLVTQKPEVFKKLKVELNEWLSNDELLKPKLNPSYN